MILANKQKRRKGQGLVEYALIIAGVALISAAGISLFGHKTSDMIAAVAVVLPGAHLDDNAPIVSGHLIETAVNANGNIELDTTTILANSNGKTDRLGGNVLGGVTASQVNGFAGLIVESDGQ